MQNAEERNKTLDTDQAEAWIKPEVVSFAPVKAAEGISYVPGDGVYNLTP